MCAVEIGFSQLEEQQCWETYFDKVGRVLFEEESGLMCEGTAMPCLNLRTCYLFFSVCRLWISRFSISAIL